MVEARAERDYAAGGNTTEVNTIAINTTAINSAYDLLEGLRQYGLAVANTPWSNGEDSTFKFVQASVQVCYLSYVIYLCIFRKMLHALHPHLRPLLGA